MKHILRLRGRCQAQDPRAWSLFQLSHHRIVCWPHSHFITINSTKQRQQLINGQPPLPESTDWLSSVDPDQPEVQIEKANLDITELCARGRCLLQRIKLQTADRSELLRLVKQMHDLDRKVLKWRDNPNWTFKTINRSEIHSSDKTFIESLPETIQLHRDAWIAYEWNYHRTARVMLHQQLIECLDGSKSPSDDDQAAADLALLKVASVGIIRGLGEEIYSTVPQLLVDIDSEGHSTTLASQDRCRSLGSYFLLWSAKVLKSCDHLTPEKRASWQAVFERIREYTGMKDALGDLSSI
jgi:hypothetical protein